MTLRRAPAVLALLCAAACVASWAPRAGAQSTVDARSAKVAVLQGLDKVTARVSTIRAPVGEAVTFGTLVIVVRTLPRPPARGGPETTAFLEIFDDKPGEPPRSVFSGWMFASSPALSAMEHAVYDIWVIDCTTAAGVRRIGQRMEVAVHAQGVREKLVVVGARYLDGAEAFEVRGHELHVQKPVTAAFRRATRWTRATLLASRSRLNMLSPKKAPRMEMP